MNIFNLKLIDLLHIKTRKLEMKLDQACEMKGTACWLFEPKEKEHKMCLVAHIDTVQMDNKKFIAHDKRQGIYWSPDGLGADDRAGVFAALQLFRRIPEPYTPYVLLTHYEETGGYGAIEACEVFPQLKKVMAFVELDRKGADDCVFYNNEPESFIQYVEKFGFKERWGTFSDIYDLSNHFNICGVNLSVGYYYEHTNREYLVESELMATIRKVIVLNKSMVKTRHQWKLPVFKVKKKYKNWNQKKYNTHESTKVLQLPTGEDLTTCPACGNIFRAEYLIDGDTCPFCYQSPTDYLRA